MKPSAALCHRVRFTTKQVQGGFYRGTRTGVMGAHTEYGGYVVDWRKVRHYVVPDMKGFEVRFSPPTVDLCSTCRA
jgi:large subunit ribosomal protein L41